MKDVGTSDQDAPADQRSAGKPLAVRDAVKVTPAMATAAVAVGAFALGAFAIGALAIGAIAIGRLAVGAFVLKRGHVRSLVVEDLDVLRLHVRELAVDSDLRR